MNDVSKPAGKGDGPANRSARRVLKRSPAEPSPDLEDVLQRGVGIRFKGRQRTDIEEYSIPEGWVRVQAGRTMDRKGQPLTLKLKGPVEAWFEDLGDDAPVAKLDS